MRRCSAASSLSTAALVSAVFVLSSPAFANETDPTRLLELEGEIESRVERRKQLETEANALAEEVQEIRQQLIDAAARVQARERDVTDSETRLAGLEAAQAVLLAQLETRRSELTDTLAALQRLDRNPPPALAVRPDDAVSAMRSALLLSTIVPKLETDAREIRERLEELERVKADLIGEQATFDTASIDLSDEREKLNALLDAKVIAQAAARELAEEEATALATLSREAKSLKDLIERLEARAASRTPAPRPTFTEPVAQPDTEPTPANRQVAALAPNLAPSHLFSASRGLIRPPVEGVTLGRYGTDDGIGGTVRGLTLETRPEAPITAPFDGRIAFAGPFRRYGQLLILDVGEGYHLLLAGMTRIDGIVGQNVLAGEPIGTMGLTRSEHARSDESTETGSDKPALYIELRRNGTPVDPRPWFVASDRKARG